MFNYILLVSLFYFFFCCFIFYDKIAWRLISSVAESLLQKCLGKDVSNKEAYGENVTRLYMESLKNKQTNA